MLPRRAIWMLLRVGITLVFAAYVASKIDVSILSQRLVSITGAWLLMALGVVAVQIGLVSARWACVIAALHGRIGFRRCLRYAWEGQFFGQVLPSSVGGDVVRIFRIHRAGLPAGAAAATVLLDRLAALAVVFLSVGFSFPVLAEMVKIPGFVVGMGTVLILGVLGFAFLFAMDRLLKLPRSWQLTRFLHRLAVDSRALILRPNMAAVVVGYSFLILFLSALTLFLLGKSLDIGLGFTRSLVFTPLIMLLMTLPISIAGWGIREISMVVLLEDVGIAPIDAVALSVAFGLALLITALPGGVLWAFDSQSKHTPESGPDKRLSRWDSHNDAK